MVVEVFMVLILNPGSALCFLSPNEWANLCLLWWFRHHHMAVSVHSPAAYNRIYHTWINHFAQKVWLSRRNKRV